jgi:aspartyl-tRNA(Asn)/glutamyl-tRNA(Gln) amidotransferase subunit C
MSVSTDDINKVAVLARIKVTDAEVPRITQGINDVLALIDKMQAVNTDNIEALANPHDAMQRLRTDIVTAHDQRELLMQNAPATEDGLFLVPKVID